MIEKRSAQLHLLQARLVAVEAEALDAARKCKSEMRRRWPRLELQAVAHGLAEHAAMGPTDLSTFPSSRPGSRQRGGGGGDGGGDEGDEERKRRRRCQKKEGARGTLPETANEARLSTAGRRAAKESLLGGATVDMVVVQVGSGSEPV